MIMQFKTFLIFVIGIGLFLAGCSGSSSDSTANANNGNVANTNVTLANTNTGLETTKKEEAPTSNNAPTLGPVINAYYDALKKKDSAGVKKLMGQEFLRSTEEGMKNESKTDIVAYLTEFDKLPADKMETRNEQINGNKGTIDIKGGAYPVWTKIIFVNEGGTWKVTNEVPK